MTALPELLKEWMVEMVSEGGATKGTKGTEPMNTFILFLSDVEIHGLIQ
jgi:hypothetical protein